MKGGHQTTGIQNVGSSCYINALSQLFIMVPGWPEAIQKINPGYGKLLIGVRDTKERQYAVTSDYLKCVGHIGKHEDPTDRLIKYIDVNVSGVQFLDYTSVAYTNQPTSLTHIRSNMLTLPVVDKRNNISDILSDYLAPTDPGGRDIVSSNHSLETNRYLLLHLAIFSYNGSGQKKELIPGQFNVTVDLMVPQIHGEPKKYKLIGVVLHTGTLSSGHYIAIKYDNDSNGWSIMDDSNRAGPFHDFTMAWKTRSNFTPYILLYKMVDNNNISTDFSDIENWITNEKGNLYKRSLYELVLMIDVANKYRNRLNRTTEQLNSISIRASDPVTIKTISTGNKLVDFNTQIQNRIDDIRNDEEKKYFDKLKPMIEKMNIDELRNVIELNSPGRLQEFAKQLLDQKEQDQELEPWKNKSNQEIQQHIEAIDKKLHEWKIQMDSVEDLFQSSNLRKSIEYYTKHLVQLSHLIQIKSTTSQTANQKSSQNQLSDQKEHDNLEFWKSKSGHEILQEMKKLTNNVEELHTKIRNTSKSDEKLQLRNRVDSNIKQFDMLKQIIADRGSVSLQNNKQNPLPKKLELSRQQVIQLFEAGAFLFTPDVFKFPLDAIQKNYDDIISTSEALYKMVLYRVKDFPNIESEILTKSKNTANATACREMARSFCKARLDEACKKYPGLTRDQIHNMFESGVFLFTPDILTHSVDAIISNMDSVILCAISIRNMVLCVVKDDPNAEQEILSISKSTANAKKCSDLSKLYVAAFIDRKLKELNWNKN